MCTHRLKRLVVGVRDVRGVTRRLLFAAETMQVTTYGTEDFGEFLLIVSSKQYVSFSVAVRHAITHTHTHTRTQAENSRPTAQLARAERHGWSQRRVCWLQADAYVWLALSAIPGSVATETTRIGIGVDDAGTRNVIMFDGVIVKERTASVLDADAPASFWVGE